MIRYILLVNKQGQTRLSKYYDGHRPTSERAAMEIEIVRKCFARAEAQCSFLEYRDHKVVYRRYASLFFIVGVDQQDNELEVYEFIHHYLVTLDKMFDNVCELDIMIHLDAAHFVIDEMVMNGHIVETSRPAVLEMVGLYLQD
eukprot:m51a1_g1563 Adaptor protein complex 4 (AP-4), sigma subunit (143) ;mRNA; f:51011-51761